MADRKKYKIGVTLPTSGYEDRHGRSQWLAAQLAHEELLPKLKLPFDVELSFADDSGDAKRAVPVAQAFAADPAVLGVVGPMNTDAHLATGDIYEAAGLAHIGTACSNPTLSQRGWRTFFRVCLSDIPHWQDAARYAVQSLGARRITVLNDGSGFTRPMAEGFRDTAKQLGAEIAASIQVVRGRDDYSEAVAELARVSPPPDLMFFCVIEPVAIRIANPLRKAGVRVPFLATDGLKPLPYFATPDYDVDGPYYTNVCADHRVKEPAGAMVRRLVARFGEEPTVYVAEGYDATAILLSALQRAGGTPTRESVRKEVAATRNFPGTTGSVSFDAHGDIETPEIGIYKYVKGELKFLGFTKDILSSATLAGGGTKPR
jgi:branched-chain amino acid transport system substrate-binding protein